MLLGGLTGDVSRVRSRKNLNPNLTTFSAPVSDCFLRLASAVELSLYFLASDTKANEFYKTLFV